MKSLWNSFKIAFSMFSKIPMPQADWSKENMKYMFLFFPWIGMVIGAVVYGAAYAGGKLGFQTAFINVVLLLIPVFITGGIHVDGLLDTSDAMSSWQERSRRLEILKDSNAGAFAVITACVYFLLWYAACSQINLNLQVFAVLGLGFILSRTLSGLGVLMIPKAKADGTVAEFSKKSENTVVRNVLFGYLILLLAGMVWIHPILGAMAFFAAVLVFAYYYHMAMKYFGGTTGDLSGFFVCLCELVMALTLAVGSNFIGI